MIINSSHSISWPRGGPSAFSKRTMSTWHRPRQVRTTSSVLSTERSMRRYPVFRRSTRPLNLPMMHTLRNKTIQVPLRKIKRDRRDSGVRKRSKAVMLASNHIHRPGDNSKRSTECPSKLPCKSRIAWLKRSQRPLLTNEGPKRYTSNSRLTRKLSGKSTSSTLASSRLSRPTRTTSDRTFDRCSVKRKTRDRHRWMFSRWWSRKSRRRRRPTILWASTVRDRSICSYVARITALSKYAFNAVTCSSRTRRREKDYRNCNNSNRGSPKTKLKCSRTDNSWLSTQRKSRQSSHIPQWSEREMQSSARLSWLIETRKGLLRPQTIPFIKQLLLWSMSKLWCSIKTIKKSPSLKSTLQANLTRSYAITWSQMLNSTETFDLSITDIGKDWRKSEPKKRSRNLSKTPKSNSKKSLYHKVLPLLLAPLHTMHMDSL